MLEELNAKVVLASLDEMLAPMTSHRMTHLSMLRFRVQRLRDHVAQHVEPESRVPDA